MKARLILSDEISGYVYLDVEVEGDEPNPAYLIRLVGERATEHLAKVATASIAKQASV